MSAPPQVDIGMKISPDVDIDSNISKTLSLQDKQETNKIYTTDPTFRGQNRSSEANSQSHDHNKVSLIARVTNKLQSFPTIK